jgi:hypothetical protein
MKIIIRQIKILLIVCLSAVLILLLMSTNAAPNTPLAFKVKRLQEKIFFSTKRTPIARVNYLTFLLGERLKELTTLAGAKEYSFILKSSLRYSTTAGELTNQIIDDDLKYVIPATLEVFQSHQRSIAKLIDSYPKGIDGEWKYLQDDINYLTIYSRMLREI